MESQHGRSMEADGRQYIQVQSNTSGVKRNVQRDSTSSNYTDSEVLFDTEWLPEVLKEGAQQVSTFLNELFGEQSTTEQILPDESFGLFQNIQSSAKTVNNSSEQTATCSRRFDSNDAINTSNESNEGCTIEQSKQVVPGCNSSSISETENQKKQDQLDQGQPEKIKSSTTIVESNSDGDNRTNEHGSNVCTELRTNPKQKRLLLCNRTKTQSILKRTIESGTNADATTRRTSEAIHVPAKRISRDGACNKESALPCDIDESATSDDETVASIPENIITQASLDAQTSYGAVSTACAKIQSMLEKRSLAKSHSDGTEVKHIVDQFMLRGYGIAVRSDQKGSVFSILTSSGYLGEKELTDILITLMVNDNCTYWYHHGQADDYCDHKFPHFHVLHYTAGIWGDSGLAKRIARFKQRMKMQDIHVRYETMAIKSPAGFMRYMFVGNKTLHILNEESNMTQAQKMHYRECMEYYRDIEELPDNVKFQLLKSKYMEKIAKTSTTGKGRSQNVATLQWLLDCIRDTNAHDQASLFAALQKRMSPDEYASRAMMVLAMPQFKFLLSKAFMLHNIETGNASLRQLLSALSDKPNDACMSVDETFKAVEMWLKMVATWNNSTVTKVFNAMIGIFEKMHPKKNCLWLRGMPNSSKTTMMPNSGKTTVKKKLKK